jgi:hypothetical protein
LFLSPPLAIYLERLLFPGGYVKVVLDRVCPRTTLVRGDGRGREGEGSEER